MEIVIITHGILGQGLIASAELIVGKQDKLNFYGLSAGDNIEDFKKKIEEILLSSDEETLCFTDIVNGSPYNVVSEILAKNEHIHHISGVNLAMLIVALLTDDSDVDSYINTIISSGKDSITNAGEYIRKIMLDEVK